MSADVKPAAGDAIWDDGRIFLDVPEVAEIFRHDPRTIRRACQEGRIPATRTGVHWRIPVSWVRAQAGFGDGDAATA